MEKLKYTLEEGAKAPTRANKTDAGLDLYVKSRQYDFVDGVWIYHTGVHVAIPEGHFGLLCSRSSVCRYDLLMSNSVGIIDSGYRGEIMVKYTPRGKGARLYNVGDKFCQLLILPCLTPELEKCDTLDATERGEGGYGSTGK